MAYVNPRDCFGLESAEAPAPTMPSHLRRRRAHVMLTARALFRELCLPTSYRNQILPETRLGNSCH